MNDMTKLSTCQKICWSLAGLAGLIVLFSMTGNTAFLAALLLGIAVALVFGFAMQRLICTGYAADDQGIRRDDIAGALRAATGITGYVAPDEDDDKAPAAPSGAARTAPAGAAAAAPAEGTPPRAQGDGPEPAAAGDADGDPSVGTRPATLQAPKGGQADDLKQIKGVGPKLEDLCHELGFFHFDQIAAWTEDEVAWVDENLRGFKGRVSRDNWVAQARVLASGGDTEFSRRVDKGDVYGE